MSDHDGFPAGSFRPSADQCLELAKRFGTPLYVFDEATISKRIALASGLPHPYGITLRLAMKACPTLAILQVFHRAGVQIDASSYFEVLRALRAGYRAEQISLTAQELPPQTFELIQQGLDCNACSLQQVELLGKAAARLGLKDHGIGLRVNPGLGSGHSKRTNVGGPSAGFGIWKDYVNQAKSLATKFELRITRIHSHIGAGADSDVWERCAALTLETAALFPDVNTVSLGGGFKVARMLGEPEADLQKIIRRIADLFIALNQRTRIQYKLELEPGAFLMAPTGVVLSRVADVVDTGPQGYNFIKLDAGMTEIVRPALYGSQHPIAIIPQRSGGGTKSYLVIGHCCESGDILTPEPGNPEGLAPRMLPVTEVGDLAVIGSAGAYTAGFSVIHYNSFPEAAQVLIRRDGMMQLIKKRETFEQMLENEIVT